MTFTYENVVKLIERRITQYDTEIRARAKSFSEFSNPDDIAYHAEDFARRSAELAGYWGAIRELKIVLELLEEAKHDEQEKEVAYVQGEFPF